MLQHFHLTHFRNYQDQTFEPSPGLTLVVGENGSGKTSLLEAIYLLGTGRSFRTSKLGNVVRQGDDDCVLFARTDARAGRHRLGLRRDRSRLIDARVDGERVASLSEVARLFPVQVLHPGTVQLVEGGPGERRRYLDWLMFHVEPDFVGLWHRLREAVTQRNRLLRSGSFRPSELAVWDRQVAVNSARIDGLRRRHLPALEDAFKTLLDRFGAAQQSVHFALSSGWNAEHDLEEALAAARDQDVRRGYTSWGAHRADLLLRSSKGQVREVFSRGQQKVVAYALVIAQVLVLNEKAGRQCLVLVDDLTSELDQDNERRVLDSVLSTGNQAVVTTLEERTVTRQTAAGEAAVFHVEQGVLKRTQ